MNKSVQEAMNEVEVTYEELINLATDIVDEMTSDLNIIVQSAYDNIENLNNDAIRDLLLRLSLRSFSFSEIKDKAAFKATLAEALRKEAYARELSVAQGTVAAKESAATMAISNEIVVEQIYDLSAALFKTKLDEIHRVVDSLKSVLTSRLSEAKLAAGIEGRDVQ